MSKHNYRNTNGTYMIWWIIDLDQCGHLHQPHSQCFHQYKIPYRAPPETNIMCPSPVQQPKYKNNVVHHPLQPTFLDYKNSFTGLKSNLYIKKHPAHNTYHLPKGYNQYYSFWSVKILHTDSVMYFRIREFIF